MSEVLTNTGEFRKRTLSNGRVLAFIAQYWKRRRGLFAITVGLTFVYRL